MNNINDRVAVITGASGNLGRAVIDAFRRQRVNMALVDRSPEYVRDAYPGIDEERRIFLADAVDVTNPDEVSKLVSDILSHFGRIDILINAVGGYRSGTPIHETPLDTWDFMLNLNAKSVVVMSSAVIPTMLSQQYGKIVNIASRAAFKGTANSAAYSVAKTAVLRITESMSVELIEHGINVNCIVPGTIDTPQNRKSMPDTDYSRWVPPSGIADVILFLTSDRARYIHGAAIPVFGLS